jgi:hypothetical protein
MITTSHIGFLESLNACSDEIAWARNYDSLDKAWDACERPEHLLWLCGRMADKPGWPTRKDIVLAACDCAEQVLHLVKPGEDRPRKAIEAARTWVRGEIGIDEVRAYAAAAADADAAACADAAYAAACVIAAADAASASAYAASAAADAAACVIAAADAASASAYAASAAADAAACVIAAADAAAASADAKARTKMQAKLCGIIRNRLKIGPI